MTAHDSPLAVEKRWSLEIVGGGRVIVGSIDFSSGVGQVADQVRSMLAA